MFEAVWLGDKEIYIAWNGFNNRRHGVDGAINVTDPDVLERAAVMASQVHGGWRNLTRGGKALHTRNVFQVLGQDLDRPSDICLYWAHNQPNGEVKGGTRTAVVLSQQHNVPTYNLRMTEDIIRVRELLELA